MNIGLFSAAHQSRLQGINPQESLMTPFSDSSRPRWSRAKTTGGIRGYQFGGDQDMDRRPTQVLHPPTFPRLQPSETQNHVINNAPSKKRKLSSMSVETYPKTYKWISLWFLVTVPIIAWDVGYCFMRPRSFSGGDLHWIWKPYAIYQNIDYVYGLPHFDTGSGFTNAQSFMNIIETILNIVYLYLAHVRAWPGATLVGFSSAVMTLSKTVLYWLQEYYCSYCAVGHNTLKDLIVYWIIPNGLWIVVPSLIIMRLGKDLVAQLSAGANASRRLANGKME